MVHVHGSSAEQCLATWLCSTWTGLQIPEETEQHPYFEFHELRPPQEQKVTKRTAFGTHWGLVYFFGDDPHKMRDLLKHQEELDFYV